MYIGGSVSTLWAVHGIMWGQRLVRAAAAGGKLQQLKNYQTPYIIGTVRSAGMVKR